MKGEVGNALETPTPAQKEVLDWIRSEEVPRVCLNVGNISSGKSDIACLGALMLARWRQLMGESGLQYIILGKNIGSAQRNIRPLMEQNARLLGYKLESKRDMMVLEGDAEFHFFGAENRLAESRMRGFNAAGAIVDEATLIEPGHFQYMLGRVRIGDLGRQKIIVTTNPDKPTHWVKREWWDEENGGKCHRIYHDFRENPAVKEAQIEAWESEMSGAMKRRMLYGEWVADEGLIWPEYGWADRDPEEEYPYERIECGTDSGYTHATAAVFIGVDKDGNKHILDEYWVKNENKSAEDHAAKIVAIGDSFKPRCRRYHVPPDVASIALKQALKKQGKSVRKADNDVDAGLDKVRNWFNSGELTIVKGAVPNLVREIDGYQFDPREGVDKPLKRDDDGCDALRYCVMGLGRGGPLKVMGLGIGQRI